MITLNTKSVKRKFNRTAGIVLFCAVMLLSLGSSAQANLLNDPGFESNPLTTANNVLNNFVAFQGIWGVEAATITGIDGGVTPAQGTKMLRMVDDGISWTQGFQITDVTSYAAAIDSGGSTLSAGALYTTGPALSGAISNISVLFFSAANWGSQIGVPLSSNLILDSSANTWETNIAFGSIPIGTRWLLTQVAYQNASLLASDGVSYPGYVDSAVLDIKIPEPATIALLSLGALLLKRNRKFVNGK